VTQFFINMEIERYTLATGETALTGFSRYWRHWDLFFAVLTFLANAWPGWITSSATMVTFISGGGNVKLLAVLDLAAIATAITAEAWAALPDAVTPFGRIPAGLSLALVLPALAFAGAGAARTWSRATGCVTRATASPWWSG
jgi:hypothetical protein